MVGQGSVPSSFSTQPLSQSALSNVALIVSSLSCGSVTVRSKNSNPEKRSQSTVCVTGDGLDVILKLSQYIRLPAYVSVSPLGSSASFALTVTRRVVAPKPVQSTPYSHSR